MPIIESKSLTKLYEIRQRINQEIVDLNTAERTAYFRRNAQAALSGRSIKLRTAETRVGLQERNRGEAYSGGEEREIS